MLVAAGLGLWGCNTEVEKLTAADREYYPIYVGHKWLYEAVDSLYRNDVAVKVSRFQLQDEVIGFAKDAAGDTAWQVLRSRRLNAAAVWQPDTVFTLTRTFKHVLTQRSNRRTVELVFPVRENYAWQLHAFLAELTDTTKDAYTQTRQYTGLGQPYSREVLGQFICFEPTITTEADILYDVYNPVQRHTVFARGVGPVFSEERRYIMGCPPGSSPDCAYVPGFIALGYGRVRVLVQ
ncbi:hypothetical protein [Hymenobacter wooponensis]|uniref:Uncharacterized protein n=1 Tax=Hymenobacter wooponensis TaxID=1525360 RepID=A0A4Z0MLB5_9BACT|nr:hypothetical protein [Hymenobacter wooponensis]TGD80351.1 hypothetical protein EU557_10940 [Hymenobacter wooponensis]